MTKTNIPTQTTFVVRAYGMNHEFATKQAAENFAENNACAVDRINGQWIRELVLL